jgi:hypothetical protein
MHKWTKLLQILHQCSTVTWNKKKHQDKAHHRQEAHLHNLYGLLLALLGWSCWPRVASPVTMLSTNFERFDYGSPSEVPTGLAGILSNAQYTLLIPIQRLFCNHHNASMIQLLPLTCKLFIRKERWELGKENVPTELDEATTLIWSGRP